MPDAMAGGKLGSQDKAPVDDGGEGVSGITAEVEGDDASTHLSVKKRGRWWGPTLGCIVIAGLVVLAVGGGSLEGFLDKVDSGLQAVGVVSLESNTGATVTEPETERLVVSPAETGGNGFVLPYVDSRYYTEDELGVLDVHDMFIARNEVFARHGYIFENEELQSYFGSKEWYMPLYTRDQYLAISDLTNDYENQNVNTLLTMEQAAGSPYI